MFLLHFALKQALVAVWEVLLKIIGHHQNSTAFEDFHIATQIMVNSMNGGSKASKKMNENYYNGKP